MTKNDVLKIKECSMCHLHKTRKNVVLGRGCLQKGIDILFIAEAPGHSEDVIGRALIGRSGKLFDNILMEVHTKIYKNKSKGPLKIYMTNTVLCIPLDEDRRIREPSLEEKYICRANVINIIKYTEPKGIITIGDHAKKSFKSKYNIPHPARMLRQGGKASPLYLPTISYLIDIYKRILYENY